ncbi:hypothetical protein F511_23347 [Dorcoceras hygrometricum]|uniref:Uncharacterized protein n=1 Tax=Dorcoceras hygrometricum TaxID=472368 RepID=A0A2Z7CYJ0_9LAMI|nr:hypothetical protein F511_23347 [Dorcoceras hygrometricum]
MASAFITNALQVNFDSVLGIQDNEGMVQMFRAPEATGLRGFLGCPYVLYEQELEQFFDTTIVQDGDITCAVSGKYVAIYEDRFAGVFNLPTGGLTDLSEVPNDLKRTTSRRSVSKEKDFVLISVEKDFVPISVVAPISVVPAEHPNAHKRKAPKRKLRMTAGSDDEIVEKEPAVETVVVKQKETTSADDVDINIEQVIAETAQLDTYVVDSDVAEGIALETDLAEPVVERSDDITVEISERSTAATDEESMSIEDLLQQIPGDAMLPSVLAAEPTKIKFSNGISIPGVANRDCLKANLPNIALSDKGKAPLVEAGVVKGHPAREMVQLIFGDIEFLIQLREQVIDEVSAFFNSFSIDG